VVKAYRPDAPLVFSHIPKAAGTALTVALSRGLPKHDIAVRVDRSTFGDFDAFETLPRSLRRLIVLEPEELPRGARYISGHVAPSTTMSRYPGANHLTVLRAPCARMLSHWLFSRAHTALMLRAWGAYAETIRSSRGSWSDFLDDPRAVSHNDNAMVRFLVWPHPLVPAAGLIDERHDGEILAAAWARLDEFDFVGLVEDPHLEDRLGAWLGRPLELQRHNEARPLPRSRAVDVRAEVAAASDRLQRLSRLDRVVWSRLAEELLESDPAAVEEAAFERTVARYEQVGAAGPLRRAGLRVRRSGRRAANGLRAS